ncbi:hypothetical protein L1887_10722 [Cichorium endivia]|nr:hypothetical protein L1887_10722 [Cichorium endivia]
MGKGTERVTGDGDIDVYDGSHNQFIFDDLAAIVLGWRVSGDIWDGQASSSVHKTNSDDNVSLVGFRKDYDDNNCGRFDQNFRLQYHILISTTTVGIWDFVNLISYTKDTICNTISIYYNQDTALLLLSVFYLLGFGRCGLYYKRYSLVCTD